MGNFINIITKNFNKLCSGNENLNTKKEVTFEVIKIEDPDKCSNRNCLGNKCSVDDEKKDFCYTHYTKHLKELEDKVEEQEGNKIKEDQQL